MKGRGFNFSPGELLADRSSCSKTQIEKARKSYLELCHRRLWPIDEFRGEIHKRDPEYKAYDHGRAEDTPVPSVSDTDPDTQEAEDSARPEAPHQESQIGGFIWILFHRDPLALFEWEHDDGQACIEKVVQPHKSAEQHLDESKLNML